MLSKLQCSKRSPQAPKHLKTSCINHIARCPLASRFSCAMAWTSRQDHNNSSNMTEIDKDKTQMMHVCKQVSAHATRLAPEMNGSGWMLTQPIRPVKC